MKVPHSSLFCASGGPAAWGEALQITMIMMAVVLMNDDGDCDDDDVGENDDNE